MNKTNEQDISLPGEKSEETAFEFTTTSAGGTFTVPVKYNKEIRKLSLEDAARFAQKGIKFDAIKEDFERMRKMASRQGKSVGEYLNSLEERQQNDRKTELLEKCNNDEEFAGYVMSLEAKERGEISPELSEVTELFDQIKSLEDLPESVIEASKLKGTRVLDEYLRHRARDEAASRKAELDNHRASEASVGSLKDNSAFRDPASAEFLKGLWNI